MSRSMRSVVLVAVGSILLAACGGPAPTPSPTVRPSPTPVPGPTLAPGVTINLMALNIDFNPNMLDAPANTVFVIHFRNADPTSLIHAVEIRRRDGITVVQGQTPTDGGTEVDYAYDPLPPGDYVFTCNVHPIPSMTGTLRVR